MAVLSREGMWDSRTGSKREREREKIEVTVGRVRKRQDERNGKKVKRNGEKMMKKEGKPLQLLVLQKVLRKRG